MWRCGFHKEGDVVKILPRYPSTTDTRFEVGMILDGFDIEEEPNERLAEYYWRVLIDGKIRTVKDRQVRSLDVLIKEKRK